MSWFGKNPSQAKGKYAIAMITSKPTSVARKTPSYTIVSLGIISGMYERKISHLPRFGISYKTFPRAHTFGTYTPRLKTTKHNKEINDEHLARIKSRCRGENMTGKERIMQC